MADYIAAMQHPSQAFAVAELQSAVSELDQFGLPIAATGASAVVFKADIRGTTHALRCFTTSASNAQRRYGELANHRRRHRLSALATTKWFDDAITVGGEAWPVVLMEWVPGMTLDLKVAETLSSSHGDLDRLAGAWRKLVERCAQTGMAHADLQHGNVIVEPSNRLRLVDFDGVWLEPLASLPPDERGHPNYQHPGRIRDGWWHGDVDGFSALCIYLSLKALARRPSLWQHHNEDNLIFTESDFAQPLGTPLWDELFAIDDDEITRLATTFSWQCLQDGDSQVTFDELLRWDSTPTRTPHTTRPKAPRADTADSAELLWPMTPERPSPPPPEAEAEAEAPQPTGAQTGDPSWWNAESGRPPPPGAVAGHGRANVPGYLPVILFVALVVVVLIAFAVA
jgi:hypothetical protein